MCYVRVFPIYQPEVVVGVSSASESVSHYLYRAVKALPVTCAIKKGEMFGCGAQSLMKPPGSLPVANLVPGKKLPSSRPCRTLRLWQHVPRISD